MSNLNKTNRREFLIKTGQFALATLSGGWLAGCGSHPRGKSNSSQVLSRIRQATPPAGIDLCVAEGKKIDASVKAAIDGLGGIAKFVHKGDRVVLSPNIAFARTPEQAAGTHPDVIRAVVKLCEQTGADKITVLDYTLDNPAVAFDVNGANKAIEGTKANLISPANESLYEETPMGPTTVHAKHGIRLKIPKEILRSDVFISMPVVKDHEAGIVSLSLKKLMGCIWDRQAYHRADLHACIAELAAVLRPTLIVADATRALQTHGPKGPGEVTQPNQIVAGVMPASVDAYCCQYLTVKQITPQAVKHIVLAAAKGLGEIDVSKLKVKEVNV